MMNLRNRKVLVVGLARSGAAAANFLLRNGARVTITDRKARPQLESFLNRLEGPVELRLEGHAGGDFLEADLIVVSPGVPANRPELQLARERGIPVIGEVELAYRHLQGRFIGVTGSNGKTTTTTLLGEICRRAGQRPFVAGNIGRPLTEALLETEAPSLFVVELSSFQLETTRDLRCDISLFLNLTPDHLDRHGSPEAYLAAKERIFANQTEADWAVVNQDDPLLSGVATSASRFPFSVRQRLDQGAFCDGENLLIRDGGKEKLLLRRSQIRLRGLHNLSNILAASAGAYLNGVDPATIGEAVADFRGVEHRLEFVDRIGGVDYFNDSKATNVDSAAKALESFAGPLVLIMGGLDKEGDFAALRDLVSERVRQLIVLGTAASKISSQLTGTAPTLRAGSMEEAVQAAASRARPGDVVLLAPGCASFDMFDNYEHRGREFKRLVRSLGGESAPGGEKGVR